MQESASQCGLRVSHGHLIWLLSAAAAYVRTVLPGDICLGTLVDQVLASVIQPRMRWLAKEDPVPRNIHFAVPIRCSDNCAVAASALHLRKKTNQSVDDKELQSPSQSAALKYQFARTTKANVRERRPGGFLPPLPGACGHPQTMGSHTSP